MITTFITKQLNKPIPIWYLYLTLFLIGCFALGLYQGFNEIITGV